MIDKLIGPYRILEEIGYGGMGVVYRAVHTKLEQEVAVKALSPQYLNDKDMQRRFLSEAKIQARLSHPNVVNIMNYIEDENGKFLIMEYARGETLLDVLRVSKKLSIGKSLSIIHPVLDALEYMHSREIIHRDIKPSNIILTENSCVKVTDFGIARIVSHKRGTNTGLTGSFVYMSPEHIMGEATTETSDIYSLGIMLYEMLVGKVPYDDVSEFKIMTAHIQQTPEHPSIIDENIPVSLGKVILKAISKKPEDRYRNVGELRHALERAMSENTSNALTGKILHFPDLNKIKSISKIDIQALIPGISATEIKDLLGKIGTEVTRRTGYYAFLVFLVLSLISTYAFIKYNSSQSTGYSELVDIYPEDDKLPEDITWMYISAVLETGSRGDQKKKVRTRRSRPRTAQYPESSESPRNEEELKEVLKRTNILPVQ